MGGETVTTTSPVPASHDVKNVVNVTNSLTSTNPQCPIVATALSRISEDSPRPTIPHRCLNIAGIDKYPELQGALPRAWSVPVLASHVRGCLKPPLVCIIFVNKNPFIIK